MAKSKNEKALAVNENNEKTAEAKFPLEVLKRDCVKLYKVSSSTFAGATASIPDGDYTIEEIRTIISKWLKKEVK